MRTTRLLLALPGTLPAGLRGPEGDFDAWFERALGDERIEWTKARIDGEAPLPEGAFDGILVAGSLASLATPEPWMDRAAAWLRRRVEADEAVLGVCFGHQLLAYAFGARVVPNPRGPEFGTVEIRLTPAGEADRLFKDLGPALAVQQTHEDVVAEPPAGARVLASSPATEIQALAIGSARGVQFHPEMGVAEAAPLCAGRPHARLRESPAGRAVLRNFVRHLTGREGSAADGSNW